MILVNQTGRVYCEKGCQLLEDYFNFKVFVAALMIWKTILLISLDKHVTGGYALAEATPPPSLPNNNFTEHGFFTVSCLFNNLKTHDNLFVW